MMTVPRASSTVALLRRLASVLVVGGVPLISSAGGPRQQRTLADKLRYGPGLVNHPVRVVPSPAVTIPDGWPRDANGAITCFTCHSKLPSLDGASDVHLRDFDPEREERAGFCLKCHTVGGDRSARAMHWMAVGSAHIKAKPSWIADRGGLLDAESRRCMGCHDGVSARDADNPTPWNRGAGNLGDRGRNHPVGVRYPERAPRRFSVPFRPASLLPKAIRLPGGKVSCVSCHNLYAEDRYLLTVPIERSALCLSCHDLG